MDASHPIFQGPFPVTPTLHDMETPEHYRRHPDGRELGATMPAWRVHRDKCGSYVGVVADGHGFEDSPDAEWIASGKNSKNARAAALARQGNFFHWGFAASPKEMTEEARTVFLNALAYMRRFDGQKPLAVGDRRSREWLRVYVAGDSLATYSRNQLPASWVDDFDDDMAKLRATCDAELGFVHFVDTRWQVDEDCKSLGLDNRRTQSLHRAVELLADPRHGEAARRVLERYTGEHFAEAEGWRAWLEAAGDRLFHSDVNGRFFVAPEGTPKPHRRTR